MNTKPKNLLENLVWPMIVALVAGMVILIAEYSWIMPKFDQSSKTKTEIDANNINEQVGKNSENNNANPAVTSELNKKSLFASNFANGKWLVLETVRPEDGNFKISWLYDGSQSGNTIHFRGKKTRVDNHAPTKGESLAVSAFTLEISGSRAVGEAVEENFRHEIMRFLVELTFARDGKSFTGFLKTGEIVTSQLTGYKQD